MFGGLDILCVEAIQTGDGKEYIIEVLKICFAYLKKIPSRKKYTEYETYAARKSDTCLLNKIINPPDRQRY